MDATAPAFFASAAGSGAGSLGGSAAGRRPPAVESWTATASDVEAWLNKARPGDRFVYASGPSLVQGAAAALVRKLREAHQVAAHNQRNRITGVLEYVVIRNRVRFVTERPPVCGPQMMALLMELQDDAQAGRPCRSNDDLGAALGLTAGQVKWQLDKLEAAKLIERRTVPMPGDRRNWSRIVKVVATGAETAGPAA